MIPIPRILSFVDLINSFRSVERVVSIKGDTRQENDSEHSFQMAMLAWFIVDVGDLTFDRNKLLKYALVHDLVEVYAGDTPLFTKDQALLDSKKEREEKAAERLEEEYPEFKDLHRSIADYEKREDPESKFIYALDKIIPIFNIYLSGGDAWRKNNVSLKMLIDTKTDKVAISEEIKPYFNSIVEILSKEEGGLFPKS